MGANIYRAGLNPVRFWRRTAWVFNVAKWKRPLLRQHLSQYNVRFLALKDDVYKKEQRIRMSLRPVFIVWGRTVPERLEEFSQEFEIPIHHLEDGFMRSIGLGAAHVLPYSLCHDKLGIYYDSGSTSQLEKILLEFDFDNDDKLMKSAQENISKIRELRLSKYNETRSSLASVVYGPKVRRRILVVGQVEDDQSLLYGCSRIMRNAELIQLAVEENPEAQIIYKPHPDVQAGLRKELSNTDDLAHLVEILRISMSMVDALEGVDRVYTLTSLAGFEALIHGVPVTTVGAPFYSGWGLTDDRQLVDRRNRKLTLEKVFAAAYMLYPKYRHPITYKKMTLGDVIEDFREQLDSVPIVTPEKALRRLLPYNLMTGHPVDSRFLYKSTAKKIALVTDSRTSWLVARGFAYQKKNVAIICTRDALANDESLIVDEKILDLISVTSIHKKYSVAMSETEKSAVKLTTTFSDTLRMALDEVTGEHLGKDIVEAMAFGLEDYIYYEALRFFAVRESLDEFDSVVLVLDNPDVNLDIIKSYLFHGRSTSLLGKVFLTCTKDNTKALYLDVSEPAKPKITVPQDIAELKTAFSRFWWSLQKSSYDDYATYGEHVAVCGNVGGLNYAYSPASLKIVETVDKQSELPMLYYNSVLLPVTGQDEVKLISLLADLSKRCAVYNGNITTFRIKYPPEIQAYSNFFGGVFFDRYLELIRQRLPEDFLEIFYPRILKYCESLFSQIIFASEAGHAMERASLFATAMERSHISRILTALAKRKKIVSIGIQPQIISTSPRYKAPVVDQMGVIDSSQVETLVELGADRKNLFPIGSVNIAERHKLLDEAVLSYGTTPPSKSVLFAMQHSAAEEMLAIAHALKKVCEKHNMTLIVKPHPHQELPVLNRIRAFFGECAYARVLARESDTYEAVARSSMVVGLFSSVLLESALYGKDVIVAAFRELDKSIDFSSLGLALKAQDPASLESLMLALVEGGEVAEQLRETRTAYLDANPQLQRPYDAKSVSDFIASRLSIKNKIKN